MSYHYWQGKRIQLRAIEAQDIVFFENLDDEVNRNVDMLHFPNTKQTVVNWIESQFVKEGQLRSMLYTNGQYADEIHYGMTKEEFGTRYGDLN